MNAKGKKKIQHFETLTHRHTHTHTHTQINLDKKEITMDFSPATLESRKKIVTGFQRKEVSKIQEFFITLDIISTGE